MAHWEETYVDKGELRPQDEVSIGTYVRQKDRTSMGASGSPFFSGRVAEINRFRESVAAFAEGDRSNRTLVFEGPPGCGKSALLTQLKREVTTYPKHEGDRWIPVVLNGGAAMSPERIMHEVDDAIVKRIVADAISANEGNASVAGKINEFFESLDSMYIAGRIKDIAAKGISFQGGSLSHGDPHPPQNIMDIALRRAHRWRSWNIVLLIDESQNITPRSDGDSILSDIHQGFTSLPIMFCAFGLHGTSDALGDVGVSRASIGHTFNVSSLDKAHSELVVDRAFKQFGIRNGEHWKAAILERSKGWPQHLSCYLTSVLGFIRSDIERHGGLDAHNLSVEKALEKGDVLRKRYYVSRVNSFDKTREYARSHMKAVSRLIQGSSAEKPIDVDHLTTLVGKECDMDEIRALGLIKACAACGLVAFGDIEDVCYPAIPSFVTHLIGDSQSHEISEKSAQTHQLER